MTRKTLVTKLHSEVKSIGGHEVKKGLVTKMQVVLADTYLLYLKTQNFHWNVEGLNFLTYHELFERQYKDLAEAADNIAERIRALGSKAPGSFAEFSKLSHISEGDSSMDAKAMIKSLLEDQKKITKALKSALHQAQSEGDEPTADLMIQRLAIHEKNAWMLRATLG